MKVNTEVLTDYLNGTCSKETTQKLEIWLNETPDNRKYLNELKFYWEAKEFNSSKIDFDSEKGFQQLLEKRLNRKTQFLRKTIRYAALIAVLIASSLTGYLFINQQNTIKIVTNMDLAEKTVILPDGTSIFLTKGSTIEYPEKFSEFERLVLLKGEAFFTVAKNEEKPFIVLSGQTKTLVLGTSFRILEEIDKTTIRVKTGIVEFMETNNPNNKIRLVKGDMAQFVNKQKAVLKGSYKSGKEHFTVKLLEYNNENLEVICSDLSELFNTEIQLQNKDISHLSLTAVFEDQNLESIMESLCFTLNLQFKKNKNIILLK